MITYIALFLSSVSVSIPMIDIIDSGDRQTLHKRDLAFQFSLNQPKYDLKAIDPDLNPIVLGFLLSVLLLGKYKLTHSSVLLLSILLTHKLLELEREKDYDPKYDVYAPPLSGLISPSNDFKQTQSSWAKEFQKPETPLKDSEDKLKMREYSKLKKELQSNPDMHLERSSYLSTVSEIEYSDVHLERSSYNSTQSDNFESINRQTIYSMNRQTMDSMNRPNMGSMNRQTMDSMNRKTMDSYNFDFTKEEEVPPPKKRKSRKFSIFKARMSRASVMTNDSLL